MFIFLFPLLPVHKCPQAIKCCHSWVQFGLPLPEISSLIDHLFLALLDQELFFNACEALTRIVSHDDSHK